MIDDFVEQHKLLGNAVPKIINDYAAKLDSRRVTPQATPADLEVLTAPDEKAWADERRTHLIY